MAVGNVFGYDTYMICDDTLRNIGENGQITGFALDLRIANYRGYLLSQIEDIRIRLGEEWMDRGALPSMAGPIHLMKWRQKPTIVGAFWTAPPLPVFCPEVCARGATTSRSRSISAPPTSR
jgi:hypothetical protein